jgi:hypothetical protein
LSNNDKLRFVAYQVGLAAVISMYCYALVPAFPASFLKFSYFAKYNFDSLIALSGQLKDVIMAKVNEFM